jgi:hypothetical protein
MYEETFEVSGTIKYQTEKAILVNYSLGEIWLPKSQICNFEDIDCENKDVQTIVIPEWLAIEKELITEKELIYDVDEK